MNSLAIGTVTLAVGLSAPALALLQAPLPGDGPVLVIGPSQAVLETAVDALGGRIASPETAPFALIATFDAPPRDLLPALRRLGAWTAVDGTAIARICGVEK